MDAARIEKAARAICVARGLDPNARIGGGVTSFGPHEYQGGGFVPAVVVYDDQWRAFWYDAVDILAVIDATS